MTEEFPHTITFQKPTRTGDGGGGGGEITWEDAFTTEAHVQPLSSNQIAQNQALETPVDHRVYYPARNDVKPDMRVLHGENILDVQSKPLDQGGLDEIHMLRCQMR
ncbi:phage head closure protein [Salibacterium lacus]|uniref:Phage head closure protein n=1 Tax=Salibacterium lacus TaxID=1898109 RepID=A0ABW5SXF6_9BACI